MGYSLCDIADAAMGTAFASTLAPDESFTTIELKSISFAPCGGSTASSRATWCDVARTIGYIECDIVDEGGRLIAKAFSTCMALRGERAKGR